MLKNFFPHTYTKNVFCIDYEKLFRLGYKALIFDIDNTLVHHGGDAPNEVKTLFSTLKKIGFKLILLSDNSKERVEKFARDIGCPYICEASKPDTSPFYKALEILGTKNNETIVIGDQIFKDILGANKNNIPSILVQFIRLKSEKWIGFTRYVEKLILFLYKFAGKYNNRIGNIEIKTAKKRRLFCEINPFFYKISVLKERLKRHLTNSLSKTSFAKDKSIDRLPVRIFRYSSSLIKRGKDIDPVLQQNKALNIDISANKINGLLINPGEVFSFWHILGKPSKRNGFKEGRIIVNNKLIAGVGGGLCNLANTIHQLILHSPLDVIEVHFHSDSLAPEEGEHKILSSGTSVDYNYIDFRCKNNTEQTFQLLTWCENEHLFAELRSVTDIAYSYRLLEENRRFVNENDKYFCMSEIYKITCEKSTGRVLEKKLIRNNRSEVMYDYSLI
ncbi:VanW family protein [Treponema sp. OMZ 792]|uniref:VanW family protein n=1 Tax=unclassified Treponema TaxID=2638727 RepID=UPI0020A299CB|nr:MULTISPECIES: VanW family protein [unclassified Treponema]UTC76020.1 VanW family protein [Treponema sp. OMZ 792]UTC80022.1 HAD hydrolase-like protein [Treponema sp. OMZ 798]